MAIRLGTATTDGEAVSRDTPAEVPQLCHAASWNGWQRPAKRAMDVVGASILLIVLAPLLLAIALAIKLDSRGPILFRQTRLGKDGRFFSFLKFRSMVADAEARQAELDALNEADGPIFKMKHDPRLTRVGRFIRKTSLDELPQLWNVLRGEMSLVGPRPPVPKEAARYEAWQHGRLAVKPGMTGLWQVSGRSNVRFSEMVKLDFQYIERWSLWLDLKILLLTVVAVIRTDGAY
ncbi:MAG TPA: sugar transferase [Dehalococcoidia bacterium]|nr:sugar transferase [Dehalococcoidia bacterium]